MEAAASIALFLTLLLYMVYTMSNYKSLIDEAMKTASYRLNAGLSKEASAANDASLVKEASELANALEYMAMGSANDGTLAGHARAELIRDFHKAAAAQRLGVKLAGDLVESATMVNGAQAVAPNSGKTKLTAKVDAHGNPLVTASPDSTGKTMLESYKQANTGTTLYDILMHEKQAGDVGEYDSEQYMSITGANENSNRRILNDASILSGVSKQEAKAPVRDRLREAFSTTSDTLGDQTVKSFFPIGYQEIGLKKTASIVDSFFGYYDFYKEAGKRKKAQLSKADNKMQQLRNSFQTKIRDLAMVDVAKGLRDGKSEDEIREMLTRNYDEYTRKAGGMLNVSIDEIRGREALSGQKLKTGRLLSHSQAMSDGPAALLDMKSALKKGRQIHEKGRLKYFEKDTDLADTPRNTTRNENKARRSLRSELTQGKNVSGGTRNTATIGEMFPEMTEEGAASLNKQKADLSARAGNVQTKKQKRNAQAAEQRRARIERNKARKAMRRQERKAAAAQRRKAATEARQQRAAAPKPTPPQVFKPSAPSVTQQIGARRKTMEDLDNISPTGKAHPKLKTQFEIQENMRNEGRSVFKPEEKAQMSLKETNELPTHQKLIQSKKTEPVAPAKSAPVKSSPTPTVRRAKGGGRAAADSGKGLSRLGKAGLLGGALLTGMAAKQVVHNRRKEQQNAR